MTSAKAGVRTLYGDLASAWEMSGEQFKLEIKIPSNTTATVHLPKAELDGVEINGQTLQKATFVKHIKQVDSTVTMELGSGEYEFSYKMY